MHIQAQVLQAALSHRVPHRVPVQVLWQTFTLSTTTFGTSLLMSHCSVGQPCALPGLQAISRLSAESASHRELQVPSGEGYTPLASPALHTQPPRGSCHHLQFRANRTHSPFCPSGVFFFCMRVSKQLCQAKAVGENHIAVPTAMSGVFNSKSRQRCIGKKS